MLDDSVRNTEFAMGYDGHTNFHDGKEMVDIATHAAMNHVYSRASLFVAIRETHIGHKESTGLHVW